MNIFEARGRVASKVRPPTLICRGCGAVTYVPINCVSVRCSRCGKPHRLVVEGDKPVNVVRL
jgi:RNase P subunit RPR2